LSLLTLLHFFAPRFLSACPPEDSLGAGFFGAKGKPGKCSVDSVISSIGGAFLAGAGAAALMETSASGFVALAADTATSF